MSVVGTVFTVEHSALGTRVGVSRGEVAVTCADMTIHRITADEDVLCLPESSLGRVLALIDLHTSPENILTEIRRGLASNPVKSVRGELIAIQIEVLSEQERHDEAHAAAWMYIHEGHTARRDKFLPLARKVH